MRFRANGSPMACHSASDVSCRWRRSVLSQCASPSFGKDVQMREIHGMTDTSTYITWREIKQRCANKRNKAYPYYGGRGITYCKEWEGDYALFDGIPYGGVGSLLYPSRGGWLCPRKAVSAQLRIGYSAVLLNDGSNLRSALLPAAAWVI